MDLEHNYYSITQGVEFGYHICSSSETVLTQQVFMPFFKNQV